MNEARVERVEGDQKRIDDEVRDLKEQLIKAQERIISLQDRQNELLGTLNNHLAEHNTRLRHVERQLDRGWGGLAVVVAGAGTLGAIVAGLIPRIFSNGGI